MSAPGGTVLREASGTELAGWDELVTAFDNHRLVHRAAWVRSLVDAGLGRALHLVFEQDGDIVGCLPGLLTQVGPLRLFGSPLPGWQTVSLGPAYDPARLSTAEMVATLVPHLERHHGVHHVELMSRELDAAAMKAAGFHDEPVFTYRAHFHPGDEAATFRTFKESARRNVRRAQRLGLLVRFESDDAFVTEHYDQLREVYTRNGYAIPFGLERMRVCFNHMKTAGHLLAVAVYVPQIETPIATGMFFMDGRELLLWTWAHRTRYRWYRPTELMTWTVIQHAMAAGCSTMDFMGDGEFKTKFGAEPDRSKHRWVRGRYWWLVPARLVAERVYRWQQAARGRLLRLGLALNGHRNGDTGVVPAGHAEKREDE